MLILDPVVGIPEFMFSLMASQSLKVLFVEFCRPSDDSCSANKKDIAIQQKFWQNAMKESVEFREVGKLFPIRNQNQEK